MYTAKCWNMCINYRYIGGWSTNRCIRRPAWTGLTRSTPLVTRCHIDWATLYLLTAHWPSFQLQTMNVLWPDDRKPYISATRGILSQLPRCSLQLTSLVARLLAAGAFYKTWEVLMRIISHDEACAEKGVGQSAVPSSFQLPRLTSNCTCTRISLSAQPQWRVTG